MNRLIYQYRLTRDDMDRLKDASEMIGAAAEAGLQVKSPYAGAMVKLLGDAQGRVDHVLAKAIRRVTKRMITLGLIPKPDATEPAQGAPEGEQATPTNEGAPE